MYRQLFYKLNKQSEYKHFIFFRNQSRRQSSYSDEEKKEETFNKPTWVNFGQAKHGNFCQKNPRLTNVFLSDMPLRNYLMHHVPEEVNNLISKDLENFGSRIVHEIDDLGWECEMNQPYLKQNAWGENGNELITSSAWKKQRAISAEEGIVAIAYEHKLDYWSRLHQICKLYLYAPSSGLYSCPLAMTDGAAKTLINIEDKIVGEKKTVIRNAYNKLTTRDPNQFWTSGQWMTEKRGGSDVSNGTETVAIPDNDQYRLYGYKWFSSATDSDMVLTLARTKEKTITDSDKVSMYYLETRNDKGRLNNIHLVRLKEKLGTRQLPTAEVLLDGTIAHKVSMEGRGVLAITDMLNVTRLHNSVSAVAIMRRILMLSRNYSHIRVAFGKTLAKTPLHMRILSKMEVEARGFLLLLLKVAVLFGKSDVHAATDDELLLLRILLPILKLSSGKQAVSIVSEGLETFGGQGYMEDTKLPVLLRDSQVLPIWEGTTNVMSLDVIRSIIKTDGGVLMALHKSITLCLERGKENNTLTDYCTAIDESMQSVINFVHRSPDHLAVAARDIAYTITRSYIGALLIENSAVSKKDTDLFSAKQWCNMQELCLLNKQNYTYFTEIDFKNVMEGYMADF